MPTIATSSFVYPKFRKSTLLRSAASPQNRATCFTPCDAHDQVSKQEIYRVYTFADKDEGKVKPNSGDFRALGLQMPTGLGTASEEGWVINVPADADEEGKNGFEVVRVLDDM